MIFEMVENILYKLKSDHVSKGLISKKAKHSNKDI